ncbi:MAG: hypothetical protein KKH98_13145, partial [Spirochaetes bacterium]|nr:hypothetical protein [Spirochaetota bacterium]
MFQEGIAFLESIYNLSAIFTAVSVTLMGIFVYFKNPKSPVNRSYTLFLASMALWSGALFICQVSPGKETSLLWNRILHIGVAIIPVAFLRYVLIYLGELKKKYKIMIFYYIFMAAIIIVDLFTPLIIQDMEPKWYFRLWPVPGSLYPALMGLFFSGFSYSILLLVLALGKSSGYKRTQLKYILFAMLIAASGGSMNFFLFYNIRIHPLSNWFCFFYSIIITFAIIRYKLMEIDTVIHRTALWLLSLTLLILPFGIVFMVLKEKIILLNPIWIAGIISITLLIFLTYYNRVKPRIDHFFRRRKYDYQLALAEMPSRIGSSLDLKVLGESLFDQIKELLYVRNGLLLIRPVDKDSFEEFYSFGYPELDQGKKEKKEVSLLKKDPLLTWMETHLGTLELSQVEIDPQYASIQKQALDFFYETSLVLLIPFVMQDKLVSILGLGKKENLQPFQIKDVELFEKIGKQLGITIDNALHHGDIV